MPPLGEPLHGLLYGWRERHPEVVLTIAEMNEATGCGFFQPSRGVCKLL